MAQRACAEDIRIGGGKGGPSTGPSTCPTIFLPAITLWNTAALPVPAAGRVIRKIPVRVENFRRAGFQVSVDPPLTEALPGEKVTFPLRASYLSGGALAGSSYRADWTREPITFNPGKSEYDGYLFGPRGWENDSYLGSSGGFLDSGGQTLLSREIEEGDDSGRTYMYRVEARVEDPTRQEIAGRGFTVIHPASFYIGARVKNSADTWWTPLRGGRRVVPGRIHPGHSRGGALRRFRGGGDPDPGAQGVESRPPAERFGKNQQ